MYLNTSTNNKKTWILYFKYCGTYCGKNILKYQKSGNFSTLRKVLLRFSYSIRIYFTTLLVTTKTTVGHSPCRLVRTAFGPSFWPGGCLARRRPSRGSFKRVAAAMDLSCAGGRCRVSHDERLFQVGRSDGRSRRTPGRRTGIGRGTAPVENGKRRRRRRRRDDRRFGSNWRRKYAAGTTGFLNDVARTRFRSPHVP